jgi:hypothetical protein
MDSSGKRAALLLWVWAARPLIMPKTARSGNRHPAPRHDTDAADSHQVDDQAARNTARSRLHGRMDAWASLVSPCPLEEEGRG